MVRPWLRAFSLFAAAVIGCGPGDHEKNGGLANLFGGGSAGKRMQAQEPDTSDVGGDGSAASPAIAGQPVKNGSAGRASSPGVSNPPTSGTSGNGSAGRASSPGVSNPPTSGTSGSVQHPAPPGGAVSTDGSTAGVTALMPDSAGTESTMTCDAGYIDVAGQCVCDMNGTFALHSKTPVSLPSTPPLEALTDAIDLWGVVVQQYDAEGNLEISLNSCGQTTPDICAAAQAPVLPSAEAYGEYVPVELWETATPPAVAQMSLPDALPGSAFATPTLAQVLGITLTNPLGAWPTTRKNIEGGPDFGGSATNGARWMDIDGDGKPGMTMKVVGPGGVPAGAASGPPFSYGATSSKCPRSDRQAPRSSYAYLPLPQGLGVKRIKGLYSAQRVRLEFHGALETCDRISGMLTGPKAAKLQLDAVLGGCTMVNGSGESACPSSLLDSAESSGSGGAATGGLEMGAGSFVLARIPDGTTCAQVRAMNLD